MSDSYELLRMEISLALASREGPAQLPPGWLAALDQAGAETQRLLNADARVRDTVTTVDPARVRNAASRVLAAMGVGRWRGLCSHLRTHPAQPAIVRLPVRSIDCHRCVVLLPVKPPSPDEDDRCDLCGRREVDVFYPLRLALSSWLILGDVCSTCADACGVT